MSKDICGTCLPEYHVARGWREPFRPTKPAESQSWPTLSDRLLAAADSVLLLTIYRILTAGGASKAARPEASSPAGQAARGQKVAMHPTPKWLSNLSSHLPKRSLPEVAPSCGAPSDAGHNPEKTGAPNSRALRNKIMTIMIDGCRIDGMSQALEGTSCDVECANNLPTALEEKSLQAPSLVIVSGPPARESLGALRLATRAPILALLAEANESDTLEILRDSAIDCQPASTGAQEIVLRVRALLRRSGRSGGYRSCSSVSLGWRAIGPHNSRRRRKEDRRSRPALL